MDDDLNDLAILSYLGLPADYSPLPSQSPIEFLRTRLHQIPPHLITSFGSVTTAKQRSVIPQIRNRRLRYTETAPKQLEFESAKNRWPQLWVGGERCETRAGEEEKRWARNEFMGGSQQKVGKLGDLLGKYEEEREAERFRHMGRGQDDLPEEEEDSDSDMDDLGGESVEEQRDDFTRRIKELFIYGLLEGADYELADWSEQYDIDVDE
ncbi:hypothetical protein V8B97DRAFT_1924112 [Scleroderma yunnanense]